MRQYYHCTRCDCTTSADPEVEKKRESSRLEHKMCVTCFLSSMTFMIKPSNNNKESVKKQ